MPLSERQRDGGLPTTTFYSVWLLHYASALRDRCQCDAYYYYYYLLSRSVLAQYSIKLLFLPFNLPLAYIIFF